MYQQAQPQQAPQGGLMYAPQYAAQQYQMVPPGVVYPGAAPQQQYQQYIDPATGQLVMMPAQPQAQVMLAQPPQAPSQAGAVPQQQGLPQPQPGQPPMQPLPGQQYYVAPQQGIPMAMPSPAGAAQPQLQQMQYVQVQGAPGAPPQVMMMPVQAPAGVGAIPGQPQVVGYQPQMAAMHQPLVQTAMAVSPQKDGSLTAIPVQGASFGSGSGAVGFPQVSSTPAAGSIAGAGASGSNAKSQSLTARPTCDVRQWGYAVVDPYHTHLQRVPVPPSAVKHTSGVTNYNNDVTTSSTKPCTSHICVKYVTPAGCPFEEHCPNFHVDGEYLNLARQTTDPLCCGLHNDYFTHHMVKGGSAPHMATSRFLLLLEDRSEVELLPSQLSWTVGMEQLSIRGSARVIHLRKQVCRLHAEGRCKWTKDCGHVHLCREFHRFLTAFHYPSLVFLLTSDVTGDVDALTRKLQEDGKFSKFLTSRSVANLLMQLIPLRKVAALQAVVAAGATITPLIAKKLLDDFGIVTPASQIINGAAAAIADEVMEICSGGALRPMAPVTSPGSSEAATPSGPSAVTALSTGLLPVAAVSSSSYPDNVARTSACRAPHPIDGPDDSGTVLLPSHGLSVGRAGTTASSCPGSDASGPACINTAQPPSALGGTATATATVEPTMLRCIPDAGAVAVVPPMPAGEEAAVTAIAAVMDL